MLIHETMETLHRMRLKGMVEAYHGQLQDPEVAGLSFDERFGLIVDHEWTRRQDRRLARRLKEAHLRMAACVEDIDYRYPRGLDRALVRRLAEGDWISRHQNVIITGPTGVGKSFIASALAHAAIRQGFTARYYRMTRLIGDLTTAKADGSFPQLMTGLARTDVLILDDWGLSTLTAVEARDLLEIVDDRYNLRSTIVASQLPVEDWHATIADPSVADAILDRLVHNAHKIALKGESMRKLTNGLRETPETGS